MDAQPVKNYVRYVHIMYCVNEIPHKIIGNSVLYLHHAWVHSHNSVIVPTFSMN